MIFRASLCLLALALAAPVARAEPVYVVEQLVVGVSSAPGGAGERVGRVKSADKLELIEREGDEAHVRLPDGKEGWIKSSYLSAEEPLQHRLTERTAEVEKLKQQLDKLRQDGARLESELATARAAHPGASVPRILPAVPASNAAAKSTPTAALTPTASPAPPASTAASAPNPARASTAPSAAGPATTAASLTTPASPAVDTQPETSPAPIRETVFLREPDRPGLTPRPLLLGTAFVMLLVGFALGWKTLDSSIRRKYGGLRIY